MGRKIRSLCLFPKASTISFRTLTQTGSLVSMAPRGVYLPLLLSKVPMAMAAMHKPRIIVVFVRP